MRRDTVRHAVGAAVCLLAAPLQAGELTGNIGAVSKYIFRGLTEATENDNTALQGGVDYAGDSGLYVGYWGSNLDYGDDNNGFENDIYAGYTMELGPVTLDGSVFYYYYLNAEDQDAPELQLSAGHGPFSLGAIYLAEDVNWGNQGDTYWYAAYEGSLYKDVTLSVTLGYYTYEDSGEFIPATENDSAFRHVDVTLSYPVGTTGAEAFMTFIMGGEDRDGVDQDNAAVIGITQYFAL